jgi:hypothetical protein
MRKSFPSPRSLCLNHITKLLMLLISLSCRSQDSKIFQINPKTFVENKITLTDIADDITYIPVDNSFPVSGIYRTSINFFKNSIYFSSKDIGVIRLNRDGTHPRVIGKKGRGPGEWQYCMSIAVDDRTETVYIMDSKNKITMYYSNGNFKGTINLPVSEDGFDFSGVTFYNSNLFASQYINMGNAKYNWIILDTLGKVITQKFNSIPTFKGRIGGGGGTFKFNGKISYWNWFNDTVFTVLPDLSYRASYLFAKDNNRFPPGEIPFTSPSQFNELMNNYYIPIDMFETSRYLLYSYGFQKKAIIALIEKGSKQTFLTYLENINGGIPNNLDGGLLFNPVHYFVENDREYLVSIIEPLSLKKHITGDQFKNAKCRFPQKKDILSALATKINETDNPILMVVRLKK